MSNGYSIPIGTECKFLIPRLRDARLSAAEPHVTWDWSWLEGELWERFGIVRWSGAPEIARWPDKNRRPICDRSKVYTIAVPDEKIDELRVLLMEACVRFYQECIYLRVGERAELVYPPPGTWPQLTSQ